MSAPVAGVNFPGKRLKELTVHHKDHNHENNPPDGSNWESLCIYCHDHEHEKYKLKGYVDGRSRPRNRERLFPCQPVDVALQLVFLVLVVVAIDAQQLPITAVGRIVLVVVVLVMDRQLFQSLAGKFASATGANMRE